MQWGVTLTSRAEVLSAPFPSVMYTYSGRKVAKSSSVWSFTAPLVWVYSAQSYISMQRVTRVESSSLTGVFSPCMRFPPLTCCPKCDRTV